MSTTTNQASGTAQTANQTQTTTENKEKSGVGATTTSSTQLGTRVFIRNIPFKTTAEELRAHLATGSPNIISADIITHGSGRSKGCGLAEFKSDADVEKVISTLSSSSLGGRKIFIREDREPKGYTGTRRNPESTKINTTSTSTNTVPSTTTKTSTASNNAPIVKSTTNTQTTPRTSTTSNTNNSDNSTNNSDKFVPVRTRGNRTRGGRGGFRRGYRGGRRDNYTSSTQRATNSNPCNLYVGNLPYSSTGEDLHDMFAEFGAVIKATVAMDYNGFSRGYATVQMDKPENAQKAISALNETEIEKRKISVRIDSYAI